MGDEAVRVLLVDDDEDYYVLTRGLLSDIESQTYTLDWCSTYEAALEAMTRNEHAVYLLDYHLSERTGLDLIRAALERGCAAPMIMLTGQGDHDVDLEAMRLGAADYLAKGQTDAALLERAIRYAIERARTLDVLRANERQIAELYQMEHERSEELERTSASLRQAQALRDDLTHMIVHDLRNPLAVVLANLDLVGRAIRRSSDADTVLHLSESAQVAAKRMQGMIDDLLKVSQFEAGELRPVRAPLAIPQLLSEKKAAYLPQAESEGKTLQVRPPGEIPNVSADAGLIGRVLDNLLTNAFKYTGSGGGVEMSVEQLRDELVIHVRDDGLGIAPEYHARIFDKFVQVRDADGASLRTGTGLGLAFCRLAVEVHGGRIWVDSALGQGSTFSFTLPLPTAAPG